MFNKFTTDARQVMRRAQDHAKGLRHNFLGTEHLLLGMLSVQTRENISYAALGDHGVTLTQAHEKVVVLIGLGEGKPQYQPFTPRLKKLTEVAWREALQMNHDYINSGHLLLALLRDQLVYQGDVSGIGNQVLRRLGVDGNKLRNSVLQHMSTVPATRK